MRTCEPLNACVQLIRFLTLDLRLWSQWCSTAEATEASISLKQTCCKVLNSCIAAVGIISTEQEIIICPVLCY